MHISEALAKVDVGTKIQRKIGDMIYGTVFLVELDKVNSLAVNHLCNFTDKFAVVSNDIKMLNFQDLFGTDWEEI